MAYFVNKLKKTKLITKLTERLKIYYKVKSINASLLFYSGNEQSSFLFFEKGCKIGYHFLLTTIFSFFLFSFFPFSKTQIEIIGAKARCFGIIMLCGYVTCENCCCSVCDVYSLWFCIRVVCGSKSSALFASFCVLFCAVTKSSTQVCYKFQTTLTEWNGTDKTKTLWTE